MLEKETICISSKLGTAVITMRTAALFMLLVLGFSTCALENRRRGSGRGPGMNRPRGNKLKSTGITRVTCDEDCSNAANKTYEIYRGHIEKLVLRAGLRNLVRKKDFSDNVARWNKNKKKASMTVEKRSVGLDDLCSWEWHFHCPMFAYDYATGELTAVVQIDGIYAQCYYYKKCLTGVSGSTCSACPEENKICDEEQVVFPAYVEVNGELQLTTLKAEWSCSCTDEY